LNCILSRREEFGELVPQIRVLVPFNFLETCSQSTNQGLIVKGLVEVGIKSKAEVFLLEFLGVIRANQEAQVSFDIEDY